MAVSDKISVAMTTYNGEKYLREQLDSLYSQTRIPDEVIVTDDSSSDNTVKILEEYKKNKGLKYFINEKRLGINKNLGKCISLCSGSYISFCAQDDIWLPEKIEKSYIKLKEIEKNGIPSLVKVNHIEINHKKEIIRYKKMKNSNLFTDIIFDFYVLIPSMMINRKILDYVLPFPEPSVIYADFYLHYTSLIAGNQYRISEPLMYYRRHFSNITAIYKKDSFFKKIIKMFVKWDRTKYIPLFYGRVAKRMEYTAKIQNKYFIKGRKEFYTNVYKIGKEKNVFKKLIMLKDLKELKISKKINASANIILNKIFPIYDRE